jgi:hypothetical protein
MSAASGAKRRLTMRLSRSALLNFSANQLPKRNRVETTPDVPATFQTIILRRSVVA